MKRKPELLDGPEPSAVESEEWINDAILIRGRVDPDLPVRPDQFYDWRGGVVFQIASDLDAEHGGVEVTALIQRLQTHEQWGRDGFDEAYIASIKGKCGNPALAGHHAKQIIEAWQRRIVGQKALELFQLSRNGFDPDRLHESLECIKRVYDGDGGVRCGQIISRTLDTVTPQKLSWLWPGRIAIGKYNEIVGNPGDGKTVMVCDLAARVSSGKPCPDSDILMGPGGVVFGSVEDDYADTIRPRLDAAGADCSRIRIIEGVGSSDEETGRRTLRSMSLDRDIPRVGLYRMIPRDVLPAIAAKLQGKVAVGATP